jgi:hypothetical protein
MTLHLQPAPCALPPRDKKTQGRRVGNDLVKHHGKRRFYTVQEVRDANRRCDIPLDFGCWSHAMFNTRHDFDHLHDSAGGPCDYEGMKRDMLESVSAGDGGDWFSFDFDLSWIEFPDIHWSIFDIFD